MKNEDGDHTKRMSHPFLRRVVLRNYKSIAACDLKLGPLVFLVGPNGSGKSNFLDALRLVSDGLSTPFDHAIRERGGIDDVRRRSTGHPHNFGIRLEMTLARTGQHASLAFEVSAKSNGAFEIKEEQCFIEAQPPLFSPTQQPRAAAHYTVRRGNVVDSSVASPPVGSADRLYLVTVSGIADFRPLYDELSSMSFYNLNPEQIREVQPPDVGRLLARDGRNLASVLGRLQQEAPDAVQQVVAYLSRIVADIKDVERQAVANKETLLFRQQVKGSAYPWKFFANSMSDGTLRALGVLVALAQGTDRTHPVSLVGIEEPEVALHPAASGVLFEALREASFHTQVIVTSHSPDLLDSDEVNEDAILAVTSDSGVTQIGAISEVGKSSLREHLYTAGELLRMAQLEPDEASRMLAGEQLDLFEPLNSVD